MYTVKVEYTNQVPYVNDEVVNPTSYIKKVMLQDNVVNATVIAAE